MYQALPPAFPCEFKGHAIIARKGGGAWERGYDYSQIAQTMSLALAVQGFSLSAVLSYDTLLCHKVKFTKYFGFIACINACTSFRGLRITKYAAILHVHVSVLLTVPPVSK